MAVAVCPSREELHAYAVGRLDEANFDRLAGHIEICTGCQAALASLSTDADPLLPRLRRLAHPGPLTEDPNLADLLDRARALVPPSTASPLAAPTFPQDVRPFGADLPAQLDQYRLLKKIGQGGMGAVYQAQHVRLGKVVALKVLSPERLAKHGALERFVREIQAIGRLDHPHIVRATDAREAGGVHFLVMEYVEGINLQQLVQARGPLPVADACELVRQAAVALQHIHEHGLVHRDIKPSNLMLGGVRSQESGVRGQGSGVRNQLTPDSCLLTPVLKVLDLGLARLRAESASAEDLTGPGELMGTFNYLAPEQANDAASVDIRADIYSLGCTLYHLLAGQPPFGGEEYASPARKLAAHMNETPPPIRTLRPDVPASLVAVLAKMLAKDRTRRYSTPAEVAEAMRPFTAGCDLAALVSPAFVSTEPEAKVPGPEVATASTANEAASRSSLETPPPAFATPASRTDRSQEGRGGAARRQVGARFDLQFGLPHGCRMRSSS